MKFASKFVAVVAFAMPVVVLAQANTPGVDRRQANQEARIQQGVQSGSLTQREAARLERGQDHVQNLEDKAKSDGVVTGRERARLQHAENVQSRRIYGQKHDAQHDFNHNGRVDRPRHR